MGCYWCRLRRGCVRGAQVVSLREGVRLRRVEGGFRSASPVDRSLCSLELVDRADALGEGESGDTRRESVERSRRRGVILYLLPLFLIAENGQSRIDTNGLGQCGTSQTRFLL